MVVRLPSIACQVNRNHAIRHNSAHIRYNSAHSLNVPNATVDCGFVMKFIQNVHKIYAECPEFP